LRLGGFALNEFEFGSPVTSPLRFFPSARTGWKRSPSLRYGATSCATLFCVLLRPTNATARMTLPPLKTKARAEARAVNCFAGVEPVANPSAQRADPPYTV